MTRYLPSVHTLAAHIKCGLALCLIPLIVACSAEQVAAVGSGGTSKIGGTVATGAAAVDAVVSVIDARGQNVSTTVNTDLNGAFELEVDMAKAKPPLLLRAQTSDTSSYHALLLEPSVRNTINIHPISELVSALTLGQDPQAAPILSTPQIAAQYQQAVANVAALLKPVTDATAEVANQPSAQMVQTSLDKPMVTNNLGSDALLDAIRLDKTVRANGGLPSYTLTVSGAAASVPPVVFEPTRGSVAEALKMVASDSYKTQVVTATQNPLPPVTIFHEETNANQSSVLAIWLPSEVTGGWVLRFESAYFDASKVGGAIAQQTSITAPNGQALYKITLSGTNSKTQAANAIIGVRLGKRADVGTLPDVRNCFFNDKPCAVRPFVAANSRDIEALLAAYGKQSVLQSLLNNVQTALASAPALPSVTPVPVPHAEPTEVVIDNTDGRLQVTLELVTEWIGGYGAQFTIKNATGADIAANQSWQIRMRLPENMFQGEPWNFNATYNNNNTYTLSPKSWIQEQIFVNQTSFTSGFVGAGCVLQLSGVLAQNPGLLLGPQLQARLQSNAPCPP